MVKMTSSVVPSWLTKIHPVPRPNTLAGRTMPFTGRAPAPRGWVEPRRVIYEHELVLFRGADFVVEVQGQRIECPADSFLIVPPGRWHTTWNTDRRAGYRYWCHFDWDDRFRSADELAMTFAPAAPVAHMVRVAPRYVPPEMAHGMLQTPSRVVDLADRLLGKHTSPNPHDRIVARALLLELLLELLDGGPRRPTEEDSTRNLAWRVRTILEQLGAEGGEQERIRQALAATGYSYEYLLRLFRRVYGLTPIQFVTALRLERAKLLLRDTDQPVGKIAARVGIHDAAYFAETFRRHVGLLPSEFRNQCQ